MKKVLFGFVFLLMNAESALACIDITGGEVVDNYQGRPVYKMKGSLQFTNNCGGEDVGSSIWTASSIGSIGQGGSVSLNLEAYPSFQSGSMAVSATWGTTGSSVNFYIVREIGTPQVTLGECFTDTEFPSNGTRKVPLTAVVPRTPTLNQNRFDYYVAGPMQNGGAFFLGQSTGQVAGVVAVNRFGPTTLTVWTTPFPDNGFENRYGPYETLVNVPACTNRPPVVELASSTPSADPSKVFTCSAFDPDRDPITSYSWSLDSKPPGSQVFIPSNYNQSSLVIQADVEGDYTLSCSATDGDIVSNVSTKTVNYVQSIPNLDFSVQNVRVGQTLFDPDRNSDGTLDLISGKPAMVEVTVKAVGTLPPAGTLIPIKASFNVAGSTNVFWGSVKPENFVGETNKQAIVDLYNNDTAFFPEATGTGALVVEVNSSGHTTIQPIAETNILNNMSPEKQLKLSFAKSLSIKYNAIQPACITNSPCPTLPALGELVTFTNNFSTATLEMFPLSTFNAAPLAFGKGALPLLQEQAIILDALHFDLISFLEYLNSDNLLPEKYINIVPVGYFSYHGNRTRVRGRWYGGLFSGNTGLVEAGFPTAGLHELIHTFKVRFPEAQDAAHYPNPDELLESVWVTSKIRTEPKPSIMSAELDVGQLKDVKETSMDSETYYQLFDKFLLESNSMLKKTRSDHLYLQGTVGHNGVFKLGTTISGKVDTVPVVLGNQNGRIFLKNPLGVVQFEIPFNAELVAEDLTEQGRIETELDEVPVSVVAPFADEVSIAEIEIDGSKVATFSPLASLLRSAILSVPERGFLGLPEQIRSRLISIVEEIEAELLRSKYLVARSLIQNNLVPSVRDGISDDFNKEAISEFNRTDVLRVIGDLNPRLLKLQLLKPKDSFRLLEVKLDKSAYVKGDRAEISVKAIRLPSNPEVEYDLEVTIAGVSQRATEKGRDSWVAQSHRLEPGRYLVKANLFLQNKKMAKNIKSSILMLTSKIKNLESELEVETDPELIEKLQFEIGRLTVNKNELRDKLKSIRRLVEVPAEVSFDVQ